MVGTTNRSMAAMSGAWLRKKMRHPWLGGPRCAGDSHCRRSRSERPSGVCTLPRLMKKVLVALMGERSPGRDSVKRNIARTDYPPTSMEKNSVERSDL